MIIFCVSETQSARKIETLMAQLSGTRRLTLPAGAGVKRASTLFDKKGEAEVAKAGLGAMCNTLQL